ncbi:tyrosine-type recombinase/integrase [Ornithinicoccus halotolerans]|uniref:tyrosine-type recombinase/integrase n=1 Tax=Ornithinicoccus halotolerans TaxID=1748220 RepID=UPI001E4EBBFA|nr:site-specific integrase [Ornithinicoccus halotolerans]
MSQRGGGNNKGRKDSFGSIRRLPSKRYQARYTGPDGRTHTAPTTFDTRGDAQTWLSMQRADIARRRWRPAPSDETRLGEYAERWLAGRELKPTTRSHYRQLLDRMIAPTLGALSLTDLSPDVIRRWHADLGTDRPTLRAHAYGLLRTILGTAVDDRLLDSNPAVIRGAGNAKRVKKVRPASVDEIEAIAAHMPQRYRPMVLLAAWCALRFGELVELRRADVDLRHGVIRVRRGVTRSGGEVIVGTPKTDAGVRDVAVPPHLLPMIEDHLAGLGDRSPAALLFPARDGQSHMAPSTLYKVFYPAREAAGRPDLRWHDLRHTGAVLAAQSGATLADLMSRLGHTTPQAALIYQHSAAGRDAQIAAAMSRQVQDQRSGA